LTNNIIKYKSLSVNNLVLIETYVDIAIALNFLWPSDTALTIAVLSAQIVKP
jgi:hypothetical protein